jgi:glutamate N-acetyltransferase / amino-acid N-acetyltransferase
MSITIIPDGGVTSPAGFRGATAVCRIKNQERDDLALLVADNDCTAAGVFTQNQVVAPPVIIDRQTLAQNPNQIRAVLANSGNANASTGAQGLANAQQMQTLAAQAIGCAPSQILVLSTGVIGVQLPMEKIAAGVQRAAENLAVENGTAVAFAIRTTDTTTKQLALELQLSGGTVRLGGMAKGSGMIHPNMATMLGVITTDAQIPAELLAELLNTAVDESFNRISVDGDTSTNDTVLLLANGASGVPLTPPNWPATSDYNQFRHALTHLCTELAKMIVRDGEGATKFVEIRVDGTRTKADAHQIANSIATSPLVKTAFAGSDANWGRILMAAGKAGVPFDQYQTTLKISNDGENWLTLLAGGMPTNYAEVDAAAIFAHTDIIVGLTLQEGHASATVWTCDLSHDYVSINADYRT